MQNKILMNQSEKSVLECDEQVCTVPYPWCETDVFAANIMLLSNKMQESFYNFSSHSILLWFAKMTLLREFSFYWS